MTRKLGRTPPRLPGPARAALERHGVDPDADADALAAALKALGWRVRAEQDAFGGREGRTPPRWRVLATRPLADAGPRRSAMQHRSRTDHDLRRALAALLAAVLLDKPQDPRP